MGLDMMLYRERWVDGEQWDEKLKKYRPKQNTLVETRGEWNTETPLEGDLIIREEVATWRKQYALHDWLKQRAGINRYYDLSIEDLQELLGICQQLKAELEVEDGVVKNPTLATRLLPCGRYGDYNEWYYYGVELTIEQLEKILSYPNAENYGYIYDWSE